MKYLEYIKKSLSSRELKMNIYIPIDDKESWMYIKINPNDIICTFDESEGLVIEVTKYEVDIDTTRNIVITRRFKRDIYRYLNDVVEVYNINNSLTFILNDYFTISNRAQIQ